MKVKVKAFANFREILGREREVELEEGARVKDLLEDLSLERGFREATFEETGELRDYVMLMKNMKSIEALDGLETELEEGDEIAIFPPVAGG
jgi:molybdopterin synthase sulfur carrier subunit